MGDSLITVVAIFLAAILMFVFPLMSLAERTDDVSQLAVQTATTELVDRVRTTGKLTLTDKETGKVVESWTSKKEPHRIEGLEVGKVYILHEDLAPAGYEVASDVEFTIADTGEVQKVVMKDQPKTTVVKTGDNSQTGLYLAVMAMAGIAVLVISRKSKKDGDMNE